MKYYLVEYKRMAGKRIDRLRFFKKEEANECFEKTIKREDVVSATIHFVDDFDYGDAIRRYEKHDE